MRHLHEIGMPGTFSNLILDVQDMERSLDFYHGLLQFPIKQMDDFDGHRLAYINTGRTELLLVQQPRNEQNPSLERTGGQVMSFRVSGLQSIAADMERQNVTVLRGLEMAVWGERTFLVADPDGYTVLLTEPVSTVH
jgi:predicted enzyme related to lactoylglutathione lyase